MYQVIIVFHVLIGLGIIGLVLMQQGKGADAGAAFGSGASGTLFGAQGSASFLSRTTAIFAALFFITSLTLAILSGGDTGVKDLFEAPEAEEVSDLPLTSKEGVPAVSADTPVVKETTKANEEQPK
ncbi:MAG: preprotein translocase subunit SecG [Methylomicrobium sp.]